MTTDMTGRAKRGTSVLKEAASGASSWAGAHCGEVAQPCRHTVFTDHPRGLRGERHPWNRAADAVGAGELFGFRWPQGRVMG